ncbi:YjbF family lipoprotein [Stenotrophomonas cyclobalanopsidis]|uniref:YjbF family lipoprotein n=1 Tax=Stenotrophomonas cyclobalanopsidis TaxID=2771362 RepID=A0ABQ6T222_9GAMM|nr:YjbF family lipoprotein [Stenotrophomonas cyclobalanopsidis]
MPRKNQVTTHGHQPRNGSLARAALAAPVVLALLLTGCTTASRATADSIRQLVRPKATYSAQKVLTTPYPQADLTTPDIRGLIVLGYLDDGQQAWIAGRDAVFNLSSTGLVLSVYKQDAQYSVSIADDSIFSDLRRAQDGSKVLRRFDRTSSFAMGVEVAGTVHSKGEDTVNILGTTRTLLRFDEKMIGGDMNATNSYWVDPNDGFIWKSRQYLAPGYPVDLVHLKPYRPERR